MAHRRIYVREDKDNNAIDFFGDTDKNNKELIKAFREELEYDRNQRKLAELERDSNKYPVSRSVDLKSQRRTYILTSSFELYGVLALEIIILIISAIVTWFYTKSGSYVLLVIFCLSIGMFPITFILSKIIDKVTIASYNAKIKEIEREERK